MRLQFCIFSFNRGEFLEHCVRSIETLAPGLALVVYDDRSTDANTVAALQRIAQRHRVVQPGTESSHRLGGLYGNMAAALEQEGDADLLCFLQDDMQLVRPLAPEEPQALARLFERDPKLAFVQPCFMKGWNRERDAGTMAYDPARGLYFCSGSAQSAGMHYSAVSLFHPARLRQAGWKFARNEPENDRQAARSFGLQGHLFAPFAMWLPEVPAYRGKHKTLALRWAERRRGCGFHPLRAMRPDEVQGLLNRRPEVLPVAEDFLHGERSTPPAPWRYNPLQGQRSLKWLNSLELAWRRLAARA